MSVIEGLAKIPDPLREKAQLLATVGSTAHGISVSQEGPEGDDLDLMGVWVPPREQVYGLHEAKTLTWRTKPEGERSEAGDVDLSLHPARKFFSLAHRGNPTILAMMWSPEQHRSSFLATYVLGVREMFASLSAGYAFRGYAERQHQRLMGERGQMKVKRPELVDAYGYDTKYAGHILRLCHQGVVLLIEGYLPMPIAGEERERILAVRRGEVTFDDCLVMVAEARARLDMAIEATKLPRYPDEDGTNGIITTVHEVVWSDA